MWPIRDEITISKSYPMLPSSIRNQLLVDEGQLGQRLNQDLQHGDRADFRLQLALLTDAVEEQPWFDAKPAEARTSGTGERTLSCERLRC